MVVGRGGEEGEGWGEVYSSFFPCTYITAAAMRKVMSVFVSNNLHMPMLAPRKSLYHTFMNLCPHDTVL